jgi:Na+/H+ antiporter NhaD/arsenite permease-like protein
VAAAAALDVALGAPAIPAFISVAPMFAFLAAALTLAVMVERSGLSGRAAAVLGRVGRGSSPCLYAVTCGLCALLTCVVSLDGAVVLMVPIVLALSREWQAPSGPLLAGVVVVANAVSVAVPMGNPTNLVVIDRLGLSAGTFVAHMLLPGLGAAAACAAAVALIERRTLTAAYPLRPSIAAALSGTERHAGITLAVAAVAAFSAGVVGVEPWWPFIATVAAGVATSRPRPRLVVPWRLGVQVTGLLVVTTELRLQVQPPAGLALAGLLAIALGVGAAAALANNLPISVCVASLLSAGPHAYAALIGLGVGSLATPHGSLATLIAADLAGDRAPRAHLVRSTALAAGAVVVATLLLWALSGSRTP